MTPVERAAMSESSRQNDLPEDYSPSTIRRTRANYPSHEGGAQEIQAAFGEILRGRRERAGLSQEKLALDCGLDRTYISLLERGLRQPTLHTLFVLAQRLDTRPSRLIAKLESQVK